MQRIARGLGVSWRDNFLTITGSRLPVPQIEIHYIEAFCRAGSHDRAWSETRIPHRTRLLSKEDSGKRLVLETTLSDGVTVSHTITAGDDDVEFLLGAHNPTSHESAVHWAQPCIRVGAFTGSNDMADPCDFRRRECRDRYWAGSNDMADPCDFLRKCFVFLSGKLATMPTSPWATTARRTPGQVWCPVSVPRADVNPRPLNPLPPSNGLIGCFSRDETMILATAWEPYQELFQGVFQCIHSDFRIGGLHPGERKTIRGKLYLVGSDINALLERYQSDFPEHQTGEPARADGAP